MQPFKQNEETSDIMLWDGEGKIECFDAVYFNLLDYIIVGAD
ncbi:hypothetical protein [Alkalibacillus silvisoli]